MIHVSVHFDFTRIYFLVFRVACQDRALIIVAFVHDDLFSPHLSSYRREAASRASGAAFVICVVPRESMQDCMGAEACGAVRIAGLEVLAGLDVVIQAPFRACC
jgi:hypothetical protein